MSMRAKGWATSFPVHRGVREARRWTAERLDSLQWTTDAPDTAHSVLLTVSELVTNAHVHAHSGAGLVLTCAARHRETGRTPMSGVVGPHPARRPEPLLTGR